MCKQQQQQQQQCGTSISDTAAADLEVLMSTAMMRDTPADGAQ
jgi:hypothetical protein